VFYLHFLRFLSFLVIPILPTCLGGLASLGNCVLFWFLLQICALCIE
jgi:hypothetical protein